MGTESKHFRFLELLPELRDEIYSILLVRPRTKFCYKNEYPWDKRNTYFRTLLSIMLTSKRTRSEASAVFFSRNHFIFYQVGKENLPHDFRLDDHWFTSLSVPITKMTLVTTTWETCQLVASTPHLRKLRFLGKEPNVCFTVGVEEGREAWVLQYKTNLARLLSRRGGKVRFENRSKRVEILDIIGSGESVDTWEVIDLIEGIREMCVRMAKDSRYAKDRKTVKREEIEDEYHEVGPWVVKIEGTSNCIATVKLARRFEDAITGY